MKLTVALVVLVGVLVWGLGRIFDAALAQGQAKADRYSAIVEGR